MEFAEKKYYINGKWVHQVMMDWDCLSSGSKYHVETKKNEGHMIEYVSQVYTEL